MASLKKPPKKRKPLLRKDNPVAKELVSRQFHPRVVKSKKLYSRKKKAAEPQPPE